MSPLPPGDELRVYEQYAPGATARMLALQERFQDQAEEEQEHRHEMEKADSRRLDTGQVFGIAFSTAALVVTFVLALTDRETAASVVFGSTVLGILAIVGLGRLPWGRGEDERESFPD